MEQQTTYNANSIAVLEGLEAVRKRPGMYIGSVSTRGLNHLIYEIVDNAVDEHLAGYCSNIQVILDEDGTATIQDNGRGIPTGINSKTGIPAVEMVFTMLHAGGKFGTGGYKISGGLHGVGASVVNALSVWLEVKVRSEGKVYQQMYEKGKAVAPLEVIGTCRKGDTGTTVTFLPDGEIFDKTYFKAESIKSRLHETAYLNPGLSITFENRRPGEEETVLFHEEEGLKAYVRDLNKGKPAVGEIVYFKKKVDDIEVEAAFQYVDEFQETIMGFCNNICTMEGGTHITGFKTKFTSVMNQYARELGILKEKDKNFTGADVRNGMTAVLSIKHKDPRFEGQTKTKLDNPDAGKAVSEVLGEELPLYYDRNLEELKKVIACAEKSAKIRKAEERARTNLISKLKYNKIVIMTDADVDGAHIATLLLTFFYRFMPDLIHQGHVYLATPPLYKAIPKRGREEYLYDDRALENYRKNHKSNFTLQRFKGLGEMDAEQLWETTLNPETRILKQVEIEDGRLASEVTSMLMGSEVPPRRAFIHAHAQDADLDL